MTALRPRLLWPALALALAACAPPLGSGGVATPTPAATATPPPRASLIAVLDHPFGAVPNTLRFLRPDGAQVAADNVDADAEAMAVAGSQVLVAGAGRIWSIDSHGVEAPLPTLPGNPDTDLVRGLVASPDGQRWMWASVAQSDNGADSRIYMGTAAAPSTLLVERHSVGTALQPVAWTAAGPVLSEEPLGIGGYVLFRRTFGAASLLDLSTRTLRPLTGSDCAFSDMVADGSFTCVVDGREGPHSAGPVTLHVERHGRAPLNVALPAPVQQAGAAFFSPAGDVVSLGTSPALGEGQEQVETDLVDVATGARQAIGPPGVMPAGWLPDGRLVAMRLPGVAGGVPGTYVVARDGTVSTVSAAWTVVGVLR